MLSVTGGFIVGVSDFLSIFRAAKTCCLMSQCKRCQLTRWIACHFTSFLWKSNFHWNRNHKFTNQTTFSLHNISLSIKVRRSAAALTFSKQNVLDANCALVPKYVFFAQRRGRGERAKKINENFASRKFTTEYTGTRERRRRARVNIKQAYRNSRKNWLNQFPANCYPINRWK